MIMFYKALTHKNNDFDNGDGSTRPFTFENVH